MKRQSMSSKISVLTAKIPGALENITHYHLETSQ